MLDRALARIALVPPRPIVLAPRSMLMIHAASPRRVSTLAALVLFTLTGCNAKNAAPEAAPQSSGAPTATDAAAPTVNANDGTDARSPALSPADATFVDSRHGRGWGDRCFDAIKASKFGWARAACDRALALPDLDPAVKPALFYNEALIAKSSGDTAQERTYLEQSLALRPATDPGRHAVEQQLASLGITPAHSATKAGSPAPISVFHGKEIVEQMSFANVKPEYSDLAFATLYQGDVDNDGHLDFVLTERNSVGIHNDMILGVYSSAPSTGVMIDFKKPTPNEGPFKEATVTYIVEPFLKVEAEGVTMTLVDDMHKKPTRYLWKGNHVRTL